MSGGHGGIEKYLYNLARNCDYNKFDLYFLDTQPNGIMYQNELVGFGCNIAKLTPSTISVKKCFKELKKMLREEKFDYVYINASTFSRFQFLVQLAKPRNTRIILHCHGTKLEDSISSMAKILHYIGKFYFNCTNALKVACGVEAGNFLFGKKDFEVFDNGIETDRFLYDDFFRKEIREEINVKDNEKLVGNIARISEQKNPLFLIDIFNELHKIDTKTKLVLVGDGEKRNEVEGRVKAYGIGEAVILTGMRDDANKFYSALDAFILPSLYEGFSISMIEAQANGLKCFTSDTLDLRTDITGNVKFISLEKSPSEWADIILNNLERDYDVMNKFPDKYKVEESCKKIFKYFEKNL